MAPINLSSKKYGTIQWQLQCSEVHVWDMQGALEGHARYLHGMILSRHYHVWVLPHSGVCGTYMYLQYSVYMYLPPSHNSFIYCQFYLYDLVCMYNNPYTSLSA